MKANETEHLIVGCCVRSILRVRCLTRLGEALKQGQFFLEHIVQRLHRARLLAMPDQEHSGTPTPLIGRHHEVTRLGAIGEQLALPSPYPDRHATQWRRAFRPVLCFWPVVQQMGALTANIAILPVRLPLLLLQSRDVLLRFGRHAHADRRSNHTLRYLGVPLVAQPVQQSALPARRVEAKVILPDRLRQRLKSAPRQLQRRLLRRHIALVKLVAQRQIHLQHITPAAADSLCRLHRSAWPRA